MILSIFNNKETNKTKHPIYSVITQIRGIWFEQVEKQRIYISLPSLFYTINKTTIFSFWVFFLNLLEIWRNDFIFCRFNHWSDWCSGSGSSGSVVFHLQIESENEESGVVFAFPFIIRFQWSAWSSTVSWICLQEAGTWSRTCLYMYA